MKFNDIILQLNEGSLSSLNLAKKQLTDANIHQLADVICDNQTLTELDLSNNYVSNLGAQVLAEILRNNCTLTFLNIANNDISGLGAQALGKALSSNHTLLRLNLLGNFIDSKNEVYYKQAWQKHLQEQESIEQAACKGDEEILTTFFQQHQLFPLNILLLLVEYNHEQLAKKWADYWPPLAFICQDEKGDTPLHKAIANQHVNLTGWLMAKGAPLDILNKQKQTPFSLSTATPSFKHQCFFAEGIHHYLGIAIEKNEEKAEKCYQKLVNVIPNLSVAWLFKLTNFLTSSKLEKIDTDLELINEIEIPPLLPLDSLSQVLSIISEKLNCLFNEKGYTFFHLIALKGSIEWCEALQKITEKNVANLIQPLELILKKDCTGLHPSNLARQLLKFIAENKAIRLYSPEAAEDKTLICYRACEKALHQAEGKVELDLFLIKQRNEQRLRLNYEEKIQALKDNIVALRWKPENISETLILEYAQILQQLWSAKYIFITLSDQMNKEIWPEGLDPYELISPSQILQMHQQNPPSNQLRLQAAMQGPIIYANYQYQQALKWFKICEKSYKSVLISPENYNYGQIAFKKLINAYKNYMNLWKKSLNEHEKEFLLSTPVLLLQANKKPTFITPLLSEGKALSPAVKLSYFLNMGERIEGMAKSGTSPVFSIQDVHYKRHPHAPGVEFMVNSLDKVLGGNSTTPTELLKIIGSNGIPYAYQASHTIYGKDLQSVLIYHSELLDKINPYNFAAIVILGILTDPQDGKPDNYMVEFSQDDKGNITQLNLVGIDNDIAFSDVVISPHRAGHYMMNIKNVLYFFPQMMQSIDANFRDKLLEKQPEFILLEWLQLLLAKNKEYKTLLTEGTFILEEYIGGGKLNTRGLQLPIKVIVGTMARVYRKLKQLHATLTQQPNITLWNLLMAIEPEVATHYAKVKAQYPHENFGCDVMKCIYALYEENVPNGKELMWFRAQLDADYTHTMTSLVLNTAEEFGFEDNRTQSLKDSFINVLKCLAYQDFKENLAFKLYQVLENVVKEAELQDLLTTALAHNCGACVYWLWQESIIEFKEIQTHCESLKKYSLLHFFIQSAHLAGIKRLTAQEIYPVNICNSQGYTPLHIAVSVGDETIVKYLLEQGADVKAKTSLEETPVTIAENCLKQRGDAKYAGIIASLKKAISSPSPTNSPTTSRFNFLSDPQQSSPRSVDSPSEQTDFKP